MSATETKAEAHYLDNSRRPNQTCAGCSMFRKPNGCTLVKGTISPQGWCRWWESRK
jgi:hypothetical protein